MTIFSIRLVQQITEQGSVDFNIEAGSVEAAVGILLNAYKVARAEESSVIKLKDGQAHLIEREKIIGHSVSFLLLDGEGNEVRPVVAPNGKGS